MNILIAEDDPISCGILKKNLEKSDHEVITSANGKEAWELFQENDISFVISDWMMPEMDGLELCSHIRSVKDHRYVYMILLTVKSKKEDLVMGMEAGADDFITKPYNIAELTVKVRAGERILQLEKNLASKIKSLEKSIEHINKLHGLLQICCYCKKIRDDKNYWHQVEEYIENHSEVVFTHCICPDCYEKHCKNVLNNN